MEVSYVDKLLDISVYEKDSCKWIEKKKNNNNVDRISQIVAAVILHFKELKTQFV